MSEGFPVHGAGDDDDDFEVNEYDKCDDFPVMNECSSDEQQSYVSDQSGEGEEDSDDEGSGLPLDNVDWNSAEGKFLLKVYTEWANMHLPPGCQIAHIDDGFRSGVKLHHLLTQLNYEPPELRYPDPCDNDEKMQNCKDLVTHLFPGIDPEDDPEAAEQLQDVYEGLAGGDEANTMAVVVHITKEKVIDKVYFAPADLEGAEALTHWLSSASIRIDSDEADENIDDVKQLRAFIQFIGPQFTKGVDDLVRLDSDASKRAYYQKLVHIHYGVPPLLHPTADPEILSSACYSDVRELYVAEVYNSVMITRGNKTESSNPKRTVHAAISAKRERDQKIHNLNENLFALYKKIQSRITWLKDSMLDLDDGACHRDTQESLQNLHEEKIRLSKLRLKCVDDHISLQQSMRSSGTDEVFEPKEYNLQTINRMWKSLSEIEEKMEKKLENEERKASNRQTLYLEWNREIGTLEHWMTRWKNFLNDDTPLEYNSANIANRLSVLTGMHVEMEQKADFVEKLNATSQLITEEYALSEEEHATVVDKTDSVREEWNSFVKEVKAYEKNLKTMEIEARRLDIIYHELKDLMGKLDGELHEFYEFFTHRPHCFTVKNCEKVKQYAKEAWEALFPVSLEVDAVLSLAEELEDLKKKSVNVPVNHLTSLTPKYIKQRWENLLIVAANMETWLEKETAKVEFTEKHLIALNVECEWFVKEMDHKLNQLRDELQDSSNNLVDNVHDTVLTITKFRDGAHEKLVDLAEPLIRQSVPTPNLHALYKVFEDVESTLHLLSNDISTELHLIDSRHIAKETISSLHSQYWTFHDQLVITEDQFTQLMEDNGKDGGIKEARAWVRSLDTEGRCSFSTFVDMNTACERKTGTKDKQLCHALAVLADNKPFILESEIKRWLATEDVEWCLGLGHHSLQITEYLGPDIEEYNIVGDSALDFERFALNITGQRKKLVVDPRTSRSTRG